MAKTVFAGEGGRNWFEIGFDLSYLFAIWGLVLAMARRRAMVPQGNHRVARRFHWAVATLAAGDTAHVGFRALAAIRGEQRAVVNWSGKQRSLLGIGELLTSITVTLFYTLLLDVWRLRFHKGPGRFGSLLLASAGVRLALLALPRNRWDTATPPYPWSIYRNVPLLAQGLGVAYLILRDARAVHDRAFHRIGQLILVSYAFYTPVILFARRVPRLGMLMIPKTLAYLAMAIVAYRDLYQGTTEHSRHE